MYNSTGVESVGLPTPKVIQTLLDKVKPHALIDCQSIAEYFQGLRTALKRAGHEYIGIPTADLQTLNEARIMASRNTPPPKYILVESLQEAKAQLTHFHSQDSFGSLRLCNLREFIEGFYFGDRSKERYDQTGLAELKDLLVRLGFPDEEIEPLHRLLFEIRRSVSELEWLDEVHLRDVTSVKMAWRELGEILKIDFSGMPDFSVLVGDPALFRKFREDVRLFLERPNDLIRELKLDNVLQRKHDFLKVDELRTKRDRVLYLTLLNERSGSRLQLQLTFCEVSLESSKAAFVASVAEDLKLTCGICLKSFESEAELRKHIKDMANAGEYFYKEYVCNQCDYVLISTDEWRIHQAEAHPPRKVELPERVTTVPAYQPTRYEPAFIKVSGRHTVLIRPELNAKILELQFDTFSLPSEFEISPIIYDGKRARDETGKDIRMMFINPHLLDSLKAGKNLGGDITEAVIFDPDRQNFVLKVIPEQQYLGASFGSIGELLERRKDALKETNTETVNSYWSAFCHTLKDLGEAGEHELLERVAWIDICETRVQTLSDRCSLNIDKVNNLVTWIFEDSGRVVYRVVEAREGEDRVSLSMEFVESTFTIEGKNLDVHLMPAFHPTKLYASTVRHQQALYEIPVTIAKDGQYYYNYRRGRPLAIFVKSLVEIANISDIKDYMNSVNSVEVFITSIFGGETHTEHIAARLFDLIKEKYISQLKLVPYERLRILDLGAADGSLAHSLIYDHLFQRLPEKLRPRKIEVHLNDIAPQNLGIRLIREYERAGGRKLLEAERVVLRARARDYRDEIRALSKALGSRYFDVTILSRLLNMYTSIEMVTIENPPQPHQLDNTPDSEGRYVQFPFNHFYASCKQLRDRDIHPWDSVSLGKYWVPRRVSASSIRGRELEKVLKIISTISKSVIIVDLCVNQTLIWEALKDVDPESEVYFKDSTGATQKYQPMLSPERYEQFFYTYIIYK